VAGQLPRTSFGSIADQNPFCAKPEASGNRRSSSTARSDYYCNSAVENDACAAQVGFESASVSIIAIERPVTINYAVDGVQQVRLGTEIFDSSGGLLLEWNREINA
jgi:hypothetical protein